MRHLELLSQQRNSRWASLPHKSIITYHCKCDDLNVHMTEVKWKQFGTGISRYTPFRHHAKPRLKHSIWSHRSHCCELDWNPESETMVWLGPELAWCLNQRIGMSELTRHSYRYGLWFPLWKCPQVLYRCISIVWCNCTKLCCTLPFNIQELLRHIILTKMDRYG